MKLDLRNVDYFILECAEGREFGEGMTYVAIFLKFSINTDIINGGNAGKGSEVVVVRDVGSGGTEGGEGIDGARYGIYHYRFLQIYLRYLPL